MLIIILQLHIAYNSAQYYEAHNLFTYETNIQALEKYPNSSLR
jgi:hypothetical protein